MMIHLKTEHVDEPCELVVSHYAANNQPAIRLVSPDGEPLMTATVCMPNVPLDRDQTFIKDYSENAGVLKCLVDNGLVHVVGTISCGFTEVHMVDLNMEVINKHVQQGDR